MRASRWLVPGLSLLCTVCAMADAAVAQPAVGRTEPTGALAVPYVSQSELLCGGAAIAMIERWWGRRGVYAEEFAHLVQPALGGIRTTDLMLAVRGRGWDARAVEATTAMVQQAVADGIPVVALIRVARDRYHYVVVVGWNDTEVTFHDPAVAPFIRLGVEAFARRWAGANQWAMFVAPPTAIASTTAPTSAPAAVPSVDSLPCRPWLDRAADAATVDRIDDADRFLAIAVTECPSEPLVLRELAGVRFRQGRQTEAMRLADEYSRRAPNDLLGWQLLASSRYVSGDAAGALRAWNVIGRPIVDLVRIDGSRHIRFRALADAMDIMPGVILTPARLSLAQRRIADIPALAATRVSYAAVDGGVVEVRAAVVERPRTEPLRLLLVGGALRAAVRQEATLAVRAPLGAGEEWSVQWRWESADPRIAFRLEIPVRVGAPEIVRLERSWETYRFAAGIPAERRSASAVSMGGWLRPDVEHLAGMRFERWSGHGDFLAFALGGALHKAHDRLTVLAEAEHAVPLTGHAPYDRISTRVAWTLPTDRWSNRWSVRLGADWTGRHTPRGLWPVAGGNLARDIPLRAHPFFVDGVLPTTRIGRGAVSGGAAGDRPLATLGPVSLGVGIFVDGAHLTSLGDGSTGGRLYVDGGAGLRAGLAGARGATLRIDVARGLVTDRRWGVSVGLAQPLARLRGLR